MSGSIPGMRGQDLARGLDPFGLVRKKGDNESVIGNLLDPGQFTKTPTTPDLPALPPTPNYAYADAAAADQRRRSSRSGTAANMLSSGYSTAAGSLLGG